FSPDGLKVVTNACPLLLMGFPPQKLGVLRSTAPASMTRYVGCANAPDAMPHNPSTFKAARNTFPQNRIPLTPLGNAELDGTSAVLIGRGRRLPHLATTRQTTWIGLLIAVALVDHASCNAFANGDPLRSRADRHPWYRG